MKQAIVLWILFLSTSAVAAAPENVLQKVEQRQSNGAYEFVLTTSQKIDKYEDQIIENPTRVVIDVFGLTAQTRLLRALSGSFGTWRAGRHDGKIRFVLDLASQQKPTYVVSQLNNQLIVRFSNAEASPSASSAASTAQLTGVAVDKSFGGYRLNLSTQGQPSMKTTKDSPQEKQILLENTQLKDMLPIDNEYPAGLLAHVAIAPVQSTPPSVQVTVKTRTNAHHSIWQKDSTVVLDLSEDRNQLSSAPNLSNGAGINLNFYEADIHNVLRFLSGVGGVNIVAGDTVSGTVTIQLKDVQWRDALNAVLQIKGLSAIQQGNIIRVVVNSNTQGSQQGPSEVGQVFDDGTDPIEARIIPIDYANAQTLIPQIKIVLSKRGQVSFDSRTSMLLVSDTVSRLNQVVNLVSKLDIETPQILIEAKMVEASTDFSRSLGIQWGGSFFNGQLAGNPSGIAAASGPANPNYAVNMPAANPTSSIGISLGTIGNMVVVNARLTAAEAVGKAKTISSPKIQTLDNKTANIIQGYQIPVTVTTQTSLQTTFMNAALMLDVTPHATSNGSITMSMKITNNQPDFSNKDNLGVPAIQTKEATTELVVRDGETAVIGGIFVHAVSNSNNQVPFIGDIPVLGWLFKNSTNTEAQREMLVFLTPHIIRQNAPNPPVIEPTIAN